MNLRDAYKLFHDAAPLFTTMRIRGIPVDRERLEALDKKVKSDLAEIKKAHTAPCVREYRRRYGKAWDSGSHQDLKRMFYGVLKLKPLKLTKEGKDKKNPLHCSSDSESLKHLLKQVADGPEHVLIESCTTRSGLVKLQGYVEGWTRLVDRNWVLHPHFHLHTVLSYRSSSSDPNFQNIPVRNPKMAVLRRCLVPRNDWLGEMDFSGNEVRGYAVSTGDKTLIQHMIDKVDFHRKYAAYLYYGDTMEDVTSDERYDGKSGFVFPEFYGSYWKSIAHKHPQWPEKRVKKAEDMLWKDMPRVRQWQQDSEEFYLEHGYLDYLTGFRVHYGKEGPLTYNEICNLPNQGWAFHRMLAVLMKVEAEMRRRKMVTWIVGQIHDSIVYDIVDDEVDDVIELSEELAAESVWDFDKVVPWEAEFKIGRNMLDMVKV